ncbi:MAG: hypothetical protein Q8N53_04605 [Longimicrobiales bacterium]|nr:hypothetical protein [Longimicrobiales bacterium]
MKTPAPPLLQLSPGSSRARGVLVLAAILALAGCRDSPTDPLVGLVAQESYAALALGVAFPDPQGWAEAGALGDEGARALDDWRASWNLPVVEGRRVREAAYGAMAESLADLVEAAAFDRELAALGEGVLRAEALGTGEGLPGHVAAGILQAGSYREAALEAHARGDVRGALEAVIRGADALREVGPEAVARALHGEVEVRVGRLPEDHPYSEQDLERLHRLVRGARQALDEGDWVLAIRRAFYAKALLDGNT